MENSKSCLKCRHHNLGVCHLNPPPYPAVSETDWCSRHSLVGVARGTPSKITDEMVIAMVAASWEPIPRQDGSGFIPGSAMRRSVLVRDLMDHGVSATPALRRIEKLAAQGKLQMGSDPHGKQKGICVWPAEEPAVAVEPGIPGRPQAIARDELAGMIAELAPDRESAMSIRGIHRALAGRISLGALHAAVKELVAAGRVVQDEAGVYVVSDMEVAP